MITLSVHTYRDAAPPVPLARRFDRLGGSLGRSPGNELVLDDPGKYISRIHARIEYRDGGSRAGAASASGSTCTTSW